MKQRRLFCEISPLTYKISVAKGRLLRHGKNLLSSEKMAKEHNITPLPCPVMSHRSLIKRQLAGVDMTLQQNKAVNLSIAAPKVNGILIRPGETFSFWGLVGNASAKKGYLPGLTISGGKTESGMGGGMCQFTNLIHWMVLHTPLTITEHHHHDALDLFPDFQRKIPFGTGTSILYNYLDYRFRNDTERTYQLLISTDGEYLYGEFRSDTPQTEQYRIFAEGEHFVKEGETVYRCGKVYRERLENGLPAEKELLRENHAKVLYNADHLVTEMGENSWNS